MLNLPLSGIKKIEAIAQSSDEYISLSQGALKVGGIPQQIKQHLQSVLSTDKTDYYQSAWGIMELRKKLAQLLTKKHGEKIDTDRIVVTHGCIGALSNLFFTLLDPGDEVIIPEPTYPAYEKLVGLARCKTVFVSMENEQTGNSVSIKPLWQLDIEKIKAATTPKTKIIIFSNPWNPLGIVVCKQTILELIDWCEKNNIYLVVDEAYEDYCFDGSFQSCTPLVTKTDKLIKVASFSKNMAMSGWRVGYMVLPKELTEAMGKVQDAILNCPNVLAQHAALYALDHPEFTQDFHNIIKHNVELVDTLLQPLVDEKIFTYQKPAGSFFIFLKTDFQDAENFCMSILNKAKVSLVPGNCFGPTGAPFLRLCYARDAQVLGEGMARLVRYFLG